MKGAGNVGLSGLTFLNSFLSERVSWNVAKNNLITRLFCTVGYCWAWEVGRFKSTVARILFLEWHLWTLKIGCIAFRNTYSDVLCEAYSKWRKTALLSPDLFGPGTFNYRAYRLQWHRLQWQIGYSDSFDNSQTMHLLIKPSAYSDTLLTVTLLLCPDTVTVSNRLCIK